MFFGQKAIIGPTFQGPVYYFGPQSQINRVDFGPIGGWVINESSSKSVVNLIPLIFHLILPEFPSSSSSPCLLRLTVPLSDPYWLHFPQLPPSSSCYVWGREMVCGDRRPRLRGSPFGSDADPIRRVSGPNRRPRLHR